MTNDFLSCATLSDNFLSKQWPLANHAAPWHPISTTVKDWLIKHISPVDYYFNQYGYRDHDWTSENLNDSIWCIGDSQTVGMGVKKSQIWSTVLGELTGMPTINLGIAGASNDTIARTLSSALQFATPKLVCCLLSAPNRREISNDQGCFTVMPTSLKYFSNEISVNVFEQYLNSTDTTSDHVNRDKNILIMESICKYKNIPILIFDFNVRVSTLAKTYDLAFDQLHVGPKIHQDIAKFCKSAMTTIV